MRLTEAPRSWARAGPIALASVVLLGFALRVVAFWTHTYVLFNDETFQYLEQGHRLAFGTGVVPWEYDDGIRSWLLPGLIAIVMRLTATVSDDPLAYVHLVRLLCASLSMVVVVVGFLQPANISMSRSAASGARLSDSALDVNRPLRHYWFNLKQSCSEVGATSGVNRSLKHDWFNLKQSCSEGRALTGAIVTGGFCAIWFDLIYFAPSVLTEVIAAHVAILAIFLAQGGGGTGRLLLTGGLFGLAVGLRFQYGPAILAAMLWQYRLSWRQWRWLLMGGLAVVVPIGGILDALTLGSPFQSIWLNLQRNAIEHISTGMGVQSGLYFLGYFAVALWPLPLFGTLLVFGAYRMPALAIAAAVTVLEHSLVPHKEVRFIYLAIAAAPILIGLGFTGVLRQVSSLLGQRAVIAAAVAFLSFAIWASFRIGTETFGWRWEVDRASVEASLAAHAEPGMCGLMIRDVWFWRSGGYTYVDRDVPIFYGYYDPNLKLPGSDRTELVRVMRDGKPVPQFTIDRLSSETSRFSHMIADRGFAEPGYSQVACFDDINRADEPELCLYRRPGGCEAQ